MQIKTNNVPRDLLTWFDLTKEQQDYLDLVGWAEESAEDWKGFVFKGQVYSLDDFTILADGSEEKAAGWDGAMAQSAFHAILVKLADTDFDSVIVGQQFC